MALLNYPELGDLSDNVETERCGERYFSPNVVTSWWVAKAKEERAADIGPPLLAFALEFPPNPQQGCGESSPNRVVSHPQ